MGRIYDLLPTGKENALPSQELMKLVGASSKRELCALVRYERMNGSLILSSKSGSGGYYKPETSAEIAEFIRMYTGEAESIMGMLKTAHKEAGTAAGHDEITESLEKK